MGVLFNNYKVYSMMTKKQLTSKQIDMLLELLKNRFEKNIHRHKEIDWTNVRAKLIESPDKLWTLQEMENTGGEPDVVAYNKQKMNIYSSIVLLKPLKVVEAFAMTEKP